MPAPFDPSLQDPLTGLSNRRHFDILFDFAFQLAGRGVALTLVSLELRSLSDFRERGGEEAAEAVLGSLGGILAQTTRAMDLAARLEDGRFVTMLVDCNLHGGLVYADRTRDAVATLLEDTGLELCAGVAALTEDMKRPADLLRLGERVLAAAVEADGGRIVTPDDL